MTRGFGWSARIGLLLGPVVLLLGLPAWAGSDPEPPRLGVVVLPGQAAGSDQQRQIQPVLLGEAINHSGEGLAWLLVAFGGQAPHQAEQQLLAGWNGLLDRGKKQYRYMKLDRAEATFEQAVGLMRERPPTRCEASKLAEMYLYWARAVLDGGEEVGAQALLGQIQRFDPKASPDPAVMPPNLVAAFDLALDERRNRPRGKVLVEAGPAAATVWVDCQRLASGVVEFDGVAGDEFWLAAEVTEGAFSQRFFLAEGPRRHLVIFSGQPGDAARLSRHGLALTKQAVSLASLAGRAQADLDALAATLGVRLLLLAEAGQAAGQGLRLGLYVPGHGSAGAIQSVRLASSGALDPVTLGEAMRAMAASLKTPSLLALLTPKVPDESTGALAVGGGGPSVGRADGSGGAPGEDQDATPWWQTWWFWTATGVVVAGAAAAGVVLGLNSAGSEPSGKVVLSISPR